MSTNDTHECPVNNAALFAEWIATRGGLLLWRSADLSDSGKTWTTPATTPEGKAYLKPHWRLEDKPYAHITSTSSVNVIAYREVKRFHVAIRRGGSQSLVFKLTDASSRKLKAACAKAAASSVYNDAIHGFDYSTQEAVISVPVKIISLTTWLKEKKRAESDKQLEECG